MRPPGPPERIEARRRKALELLATGLSLSEVARLVGCAPSSVLRWRDAYRRHGESALSVKRPPGRPPRLNSQQLRELANMVQTAPPGSPGGWTCRRVASYVESRYGVKYHPAHVSRLLKRLKRSG
jgi:transposase